MSSSQELSNLVGKLKGRTIKSDHQRFAERSQALRWFAERDLKELRAMRAGFEAMKARKKGGNA